MENYQEEDFSLQSLVIIKTGERTKSTIERITTGKIMIEADTEKNETVATEVAVDPGETKVSEVVQETAEATVDPEEKPIQETVTTLGTEEAPGRVIVEDQIMNMFVSVLKRKLKLKKRH